MNRRKFVIAIAALPAVVAAAALLPPVAMACVCTCGGMLGGGDEDFYDGLQWCDYCRDSMRQRPTLVVNMIPDSGREIMARYDALRICDAGLKPRTWSREMAAEMLEVMRGVYEPHLVALA